MSRLLPQDFLALRKFCHMSVVVNKLWLREFRSAWWGAEKPGGYHRWWTWQREKHLGSTVEIDVTIWHASPSNDPITPYPTSYPGWAQMAFNIYLIDFFYDIVLALSKWRQKVCILLGVSAKVELKEEERSFWGQTTSGMSAWVGTGVFPVRIGKYDPRKEADEPTSH